MTKETIFLLTVIALTQFTLSPSVHAEEKVIHECIAEYALYLPATGEAFVGDDPHKMIELTKPATSINYSQERLAKSVYLEAMTAIRAHTLGINPHWKTGSGLMGSVYNVLCRAKSYVVMDPEVYEESAD